MSLLRERFSIATEGGRAGYVTRTRPAGAPARAAIVLVHGYAQNRLSWHLPGRSLADDLADVGGFDVFNLELSGHGRSREAGHPCAPDFDADVADLCVAVSAIRRRASCAQLFGIGHSLGASTLFAAAPDLAEPLAGLVAVAGPWRLCFHRPSLTLLAGVTAELGRLLPRSHAVPAVRIDLLGLLLRLGLPLYDSRLNPLPYMAWRAGSIERPLLRRRLTQGFDRVSAGVTLGALHWAWSGRFVSHDRQIDHAARFAALDSPLLVAAGDEDALVPPADARLAYEASQSRDKEWVLFSAAEHGVAFGHLDLLCGRAAPRIVWPALRAWLTARVHENVT